MIRCFFVEILLPLSLTHTNKQTHSLCSNKKPSPAKCVSTEEPRSTLTHPPTHSAARRGDSRENNLGTFLGQRE